MICQKTFTQLSLENLVGESAASPAAQLKSQLAEETVLSVEDQERIRRSQYIKKWYEKNPDKRHAYYLSYMERHGKELMDKRRQPEERAKINAAMRKWGQDHKKERAAYNKAYYLLHRHDPKYMENNRKANKRHYQNHLEQERERGRLNAKKFKETTNARNRRLRRTDLNFAMKDRLRATMNRGLRRQWARKSRRTMELVGCSVEEFRAHIEKQFKPGMSWENRRKWHVDHIRPLSSFDLTDPEQQKIAFNYKNLQPLWAHENHAKSDKFEAAKSPAAVSSLPGCGVGSGS